MMCLNPGTGVCVLSGPPDVKAPLALALLLLPAFGIAHASEIAQTWTIDSTQSQVQFAARKFWFARVRGTFPALSGTLHRIDTHIGADLGRVDADLAITGLQMDDADDRERALGAGFFDATQFPFIHFDSDPFPMSELVAGGVLRGILTLHGERHPVTLALQPSDCPRQPLQCVIRVHGTISRFAFGVHGWRGVLSDKVQLDLRIVLRSSVSAASSDLRPDTGNPAS